MNLTPLKNYAPAARTAFAEAVTRRAGVFGVHRDWVEPVTESGDLALIGGQAFPRSILPLRRKLTDLIQRDGFDHTMEAMAYTWFNRFVALRFMELHDGWLDHGYRVLSHPEGNSLPEILQHAEHVDFKGLDRAEVIRLKLDGNRDEELYRLLLLAQCEELHRILPDVFSKLDDATVLVLPDNLLHSDSLIRQLVANSNEEDWQQVEILGWLYQFYISEKKDQVMARKSAVPTEDIPAVTQLFTPHWIVRYLVENSLGRLWLLNRPGSRLREHMPYYIEEASSPVASGQGLVAGSESGASHQPLVTNHSAAAPDSYLKIDRPQDIKLMDPAVGSGHMLTYGFDLLYLIYEEEGHTPSEIPGLILRFNLHGLEICPRAAQLAELALVFKARNASRRFFQPEHFVRPAIIELREVRFAENELRDYIRALGLGDLFHQPLLKLLHQFEEAKNFGSLIQPCLDERTISEVRRAIEGKDLGGQLFLRETHLKVLRVLEQAEALTRKCHVVTANPPYMGSAAMNSELKDFIETHFKDGKADTYAAFMLRNLRLTLRGGFVAMITIPNWTSLKVFESLRNTLIRTTHISSLLAFGRGVWGSDFGSCAFTLQAELNLDKKGLFKKLFRRQGEVQSNEELEANFFDASQFPTYLAGNSDFDRIAGQPIAYWLSRAFLDAFSKSPPLSKLGLTRLGMTTANNNLFTRLWHEVSGRLFSPNATNAQEVLSSRKKWVPYNKGGAFRKWYGNLDTIVNWENDGYAIKHYGAEDGKIRSTVPNTEFYFKECITWSKVSIGALAMRYRPVGSIFDVAGACVYGDTTNLRFLLAFCNSIVAVKCLEVLSPTLNFEGGHIACLPIIDASELKAQITEVVPLLIEAARADWDNFETSWDFRDQPLLRPGLKGATLEASWRNWEAQSTAAIRRMQELETENNRLFIAAYGLDGELHPEVPEEQITLARADARRDMAAFLSYAVGCMMGRYSLEALGLILANAGDTVEDYVRIVAERRANTVASGQGLVVSEEEKQNDKKLQRSDRVAEGHAAGDANLQSYEAVPQGRTLRSDESNSQSSGVHPVKYSGGPGETGDGGIQTLSVDRPGVSGGSGDPASDRSGSELPLDVGPGGDPSDSHRNRQDAQRADKNPEPQTLTTGHQPLASSHQPLATSHQPLASRFHPDTDGILPVLDGEWFEDDIVARTREFLRVTFGKTTLDENIEFIEGALGKDLRSYFQSDFYKNHLQTYKNRPIYWLFSSGKQKAFQCLVYLHRYTPGTLARIRTEYAIPLQGKLSATIGRLEEELPNASSSSARKKLQTELDKAKKQMTELLAYDEHLRSYADQRITLDLDDGVKVNYAKFGPLVADSKKVCGTKED